MDVVRRSARLHSFPQAEQRVLAKLTARWLRGSGAERPTLLASVQGPLLLRTACLGCGDVSVACAPIEQASHEAAMLDEMRSGRRLFFETGFDGALPAELRYIDCVEPVLDAREYVRLHSATASLTLSCPSGRVGLSDASTMLLPWAETRPEGSLELELGEGAYAACAYAWSGPRGDRLVVVLCRGSAGSGSAPTAVVNIFS